MNAGAREVNAAARRFVPVETRKASCGRIRVNKCCVIDEAIITESAKALQESPIDWPNFPISANTKVIRSRARVTEKLKLVSALMVGAEKWSAVTFGRVTHSKSDLLILREDGEIEIAKLRASVVTVIARDWIR